MSERERPQLTLSCVIRELDSDTSLDFSRPGLNSQNRTDVSTEPVFMESMLDGDDDDDVEDDTSSSLSLSPTFDDKETSLGRGNNQHLPERSDLEESSGHASWEMDVQSVETKELETVFEDDVLSDSSGYLERSSSNCSIVSDFRDRSDSTWSAMTLADRERSNSIATSFRERSYSTTCAYNDHSFGGGGCGHRQRSYSTASEGRQRSASIGSLMPNPLHQSHHLSVHYLKSAFTFLNPKGT